MKTWSILPFAVLGILLALLLAVSACDDDGFKSNDFGGPYSFGGERDDEKTEVFEKKKRKDFKSYKDKELFFSEVAELTRVLLEQSIRANAVFPFGDKQQKYNYVVVEKDKVGTIFVAKWRHGVVYDDVTHLLVDGKCSPARGKASSMSLSLQGMINWFPEDSKNGLSPCWLDRDKKDGLLDAISKHLMLAQGKGTTIDKYVPRWTSKDVEVAYAGELIVDLVSCTYSLNNDSGTYGPKGDELKSVAEYFADKIGVGPFSYVDFDFGENGKIKSREIHSTDNLSTEIFPLCP